MKVALLALWRARPVRQQKANPSSLVRGLLYELFVVALSLMTATNAGAAPVVVTGQASHTL
jgi:hypothetical protein